jgi:hypothetical protein
VLKVILLSTVPGKCCAKFEVDGHTSSGNDQTSDPDEQRKTNTSTARHDTTRCSKDTSSDHAVEDEKDSAHETDLSAAFAGLVDIVAIVA